MQQQDRSRQNVIELFFLYPFHAPCGIRQFHSSPEAEVSLAACGKLLFLPFHRCEVRCRTVFLHPGLLRRGSASGGRSPSPPEAPSGMRHFAAGILPAFLPGLFWERRLRPPGHFILYAPVHRIYDRCVQEADSRREEPPQICRVPVLLPHGHLRPHPERDGASAAAPGGAGFRLFQGPRWPPCTVCCGAIC